MTSSGHWQSEAVFSFSRLDGRITAAAVPMLAAAAEVGCKQNTESIGEEVDVEGTVIYDRAESVLVRAFLSMPRTGSLTNSVTSSKSALSSWGSPLWKFEKAVMSEVS